MTIPSYAAPLAFIAGFALGYFWRWTSVRDIMWRDQRDLKRLDEWRHIERIRNGDP